MFEISGLRSWNLNADDFEAMVNFYRDKLGIQESGRQTIAGAEVVRLRAGSQGIGLARKKGHERIVPQPVVVV